MEQFDKNPPKVCEITPAESLRAHIDPLFTGRLPLGYDRTLNCIEVISEDVSADSLRPLAIRLIELIASEHTPGTIRSISLSCLCCWADKLPEVQNELLKAIRAELQKNIPPFQFFAIPELSTVASESGWIIKPLAEAYLLSQEAPPLSHALATITLLHQLSRYEWGRDIESSGFHSIHPQKLEILRSITGLTDILRVHSDYFTHQITTYDDPISLAAKASLLLLKILISEPDELEQLGSELEDFLADLQYEYKSHLITGSEIVGIARTIKNAMRPSLAVASWLKETSPHAYMTGIPTAQALLDSLMQTHSDAMAAGEKVLVVGDVVTGPLWDMATLFAVNNGASSSKRSIATIVTPEEEQDPFEIIGEIAQRVGRIEPFGVSTENNSIGKLPLYDQHSAGSYAELGASWEGVIAFPYLEDDDGDFSEFPEISDTLIT